jgi:predicted nucleotidyltransferase
MSEITVKIAKTLEHLEGVAAVILFGSQALGHAKQGSDVDVAVLFEHTKLPSAMNLLEIRNQLEDTLSSSVDLVCLNTSSPIIGMQVYKYGQPIIIPDQKLYDRYLIRLFTDYNDLKYLRKEAENTILERKFYG